jgi:Glycosyltransferase Family 4
VRVLITNHELAFRAGTELYVRDVALRLLTCGHRPIAYSRRLGEVAEEIRGAGVPVLDDLERLEEAPDVVHGHHHLETMTAALRFPAVPVLAFCHGWLPPQEAPPRFPTIRRYVAVDAATRDRLLVECGLAPARVVVLPNFVDLERFAPRPPLPVRPRRALVFSNRATEGRHLPAVRAACAEAGLALDVVGLESGTPCARPEEILGGYDVVFAKGRAGLEAAAVGAAVVLCDADGLGPMVTAAELPRLRAANFGLRLLREAVTPAAVARELARYDPADAAAVTARLRREAGLAEAVDRLLALYGEVIAEQRQAGPPEPWEVARAASAYLRHGPLRGGDTFAAERERLQAVLGEERRRAEAAGEERDRLTAELAATRAESQRLATELAAAGAESQRLAAAGEGLRREAAERRAALAGLEGELGWMRDTAAWRWRQRLLGGGWRRRLYRRLRGLPAEEA